jgi:hypothetical protein
MAVSKTGRYIANGGQPFFSHAAAFATPVASFVTAASFGHGEASSTWSTAA